MNHCSNPLRMRIGLLPLLVAGSISSGIVHAQSVWDGGGADNNWTTAANWAGDVAPTSAITTDIQFGGGTRLSPTLTSAFSVRTIVFNAGAGAFALGGSTISVQGPGSADSNAIRNNSSVLQTIGNNINLVSGTLSAGNAGITMDGILTVSGGVRLTAANSGVLTMNGKISGTTTGNFLAFNGNGTVRINAVNDYVGGTKIWDSTVIISQDALGTGGAFGNSATEIEFGTGSGTFAPTLLISGAHRVDRTLRLISNATSTVTLGGESAAVSSFDRTVTVGSDNGAAMALRVQSVAGGRVDFNGNIVRATGATGSADTLTKLGAGIVALDGANTYSGATTVNAGTLLINGSLSAGGAGVSVLAGATLGGEGTINRSVNVAANASFSPGDMDGSGISLADTITINGALSFADSSLVKFDLGLSGSDFVAVNGALVLDGVLSITRMESFGAGTYQLFSYTAGMLTDNGLSLSGLPADYGYALDFSTAGQVNLVVSAVPEPATSAAVLGMLALGAAGFGRSRRHR